MAVLLAGAALLVTAILMRHQEADRYRRQRRDVQQKLLQHQVTGHATALGQMSSWRRHIDTEFARLNGYVEGAVAAASGSGELARYMGRADEHLTVIAGRLEQLTHLPSARPSGGADPAGRMAGDEPDREVLVYVGHRVHSLVSRMLERLKATEREQEDPDLLDDLYRIDHLATQLRRAAERLAVLGGHTARRAHSPVPISTVLRQAVAEVEDYPRIQLTLPDDDPKIPGHAGPDVIHVVAELLENATKFSRPDTAVMMSTRSTPEGLGVEISDEGLPLTAEKLEDLRRILADPHRISPREQVRQGQIGMLVAGRLAARHSLRIELHPEASGTRALVVLPNTLLTATAPGVPAASAPSLPHRRTAAPVASPAGPPVAASPSGARPALPRRSQAAASPPLAPRSAGPPLSPSKPPTPGLMSAFTSGVHSGRESPQQDPTDPATA
ncbi:ATP-binding protein [Spirillospora sp. NPDC047418]